MDSKEYIKEDKNMTRLETIDLMINKAKEITGSNSRNWTRDAENEIWTLASDWNSAHYGSREAGEGEIFMCEIWKVDGYDYDGFMIEDDLFSYED